MEMDIQFFAQSAIGIAMVAAFVEAIKKAGLPSHYLPLVSIAIGLAYGILIGYATGSSLLVGALTGFSYGATASTGYDVFSGMKKRKES